MLIFLFIALILIVALAPRADASYRVRNGHCPACGVPTTYQRIKVDEQIAGHAPPVCEWFRLHAKHVQRKHG